MTRRTLRPVAAGGRRSAARRPLAAGGCQSGKGGRVVGSAGGRAPDRRRQPGPGAHQRHRIAGGRRAGLRPAGALLGRPPRAGGGSGDQLDGQLGRHHLDLRAAPERALPRRHAARRRRGRVLVRTPDRARAPRPRGRLRLDARLPQHPARARRRAVARPVRDRSPVRAVPRQPGDGAGGDRVADGGAQVEARLRAAPGGHGAVPLRRVDSRATASRWSATPTTGTSARARATWC